MGRRGAAKGGTRKEKGFRGPEHARRIQWRAVGNRNLHITGSGATTTCMCGYPVKHPGKPQLAHHWIWGSYNLHVQISGEASWEAAACASHGGGSCPMGGPRRRSCRFASRHNLLPLWHRSIAASREEECGWMSALPSLLSPNVALGNAGSGRIRRRAPSPNRYPPVLTRKPLVDRVCPGRLGEYRPC